MWRFSLLLLAACGGPPPECVTPCGVAVYAYCDGVEAAENKAIATYAEEIGWDMHQMCKSLDGWSLRLNSVLLKEDLAGRTTYSEKLIETISFDWKHSALPHEYVHVFEDAIEHRREVDHGTWAQRGFFQAIEDVKK